jgi:1-acyl-sn-glycerol-3-phosphate acyltransferase
MLRVAGHYSPGSCPVPPHHSPTVRWFWDRYLAVKFRAAFADMHFDLSACEKALDPALPVILVPNHISWWDGFFCFEIQRRLRPGSGIYSLMLESELRKFPVLRKVGCFGMDPGNPISVRRAFKEFKNLIATNPYRTLTYFPQGAIRPQGQRPLGFKRGIELFSQMGGDVQCVPVALQIEPMTAQRPVAFIHAGSPMNSRTTKISAACLESEVTRLLDAVSLSRAKEILEAQP